MVKPWVLVCMLGGPVLGLRDSATREPTLPLVSVQVVPWEGVSAQVREVTLEAARLWMTPVRVAACPEGMVVVQGSYCPQVQHRCQKWLDDPKLPYARCGVYHQAVECLGSRRPLEFCMDRYEHTDPGQKLPRNHMSFVTASALCRQLGKRLCTEDEWNFACEGEEMRPYPYGFRREPKCNQDRLDLYEIKLVEGQPRQVLKDQREPADHRPDCVSPFGVYNLTGNLDESVLREEARLQSPYRNALKGGWWMPARNRCRPATTAHDDEYQDTQVGVRCCADLKTGEDTPEPGVMAGLARPADQMSAGTERRNRPPS
jgi:sulfatase modifying factor 1